MLERCSQMTIAAMITQQIVLKKNGRQVRTAGNQVDESAHRVQRSNDDAAQRDNAGDSDLNQEDAQ